MALSHLSKRGRSENRWPAQHTEPSLEAGEGGDRLVAHGAKNAVDGSGEYDDDEETDNDEETETGAAPTVVQGGTGE
jgi:hypothetical protein